MVKSNNWRKVILILVCFSFNYALAQNGKKAIRSGYYFVLQIESVKGDTIFFKTVNIYSTTPSVKIVEIDTLKSVSNKSNFLLARKFNKGLYKKANDRMVGKILILNTTIDNITENGFVTFKKPIQLKGIMLKDFYEVRR